MGKDENQILENGLIVLAKYQMMVDDIDEDMRTCHVAGTCYRGDISVTFGIPDWDDDIPYVRLNAYDEKEFAVDVFGFLEALNLVMIKASGFISQSRFGASHIEVYQHIRPAFVNYFEFLTNYEQAGFPMWNGLAYLKTQVCRAHDQIYKNHGYIYLVQAVSPYNHYKIGLSKEPVKRIESMGVKLPFPIEVIHLIQASDRYVAEKSLHNRYAHKRVNGEWFELSEQDVKDICSIQIIDIAGEVLS